MTFLSSPAAAAFAAAPSVGSPTVILAILCGTQSYRTSRIATVIVWIAVGHALAQCIELCVRLLIQLCLGLVWKDLLCLASYRNPCSL